MTENKDIKTNKADVTVESKTDVVKTEVTKTTSKMKNTKKSKPVSDEIVAVATEVISGQYGIGETCKFALKELGYDYDEVMTEVANQLK